MGWRAGLYFGIGSFDRFPLTRLNIVWLGLDWALNTLWLPWLWSSTFKPNTMSLWSIKKKLPLITKKNCIELADWELNMQNQPNEITCLWLQEPSSRLRRFKANLTRSCFSPVIFWQFFELYISFQQHYSVLIVFIWLIFCILSKWGVSSEPYLSRNEMPRNPIVIKIYLCFSGTDQPVQLSLRCTELIIKQSKACILSHCTRWEWDIVQLENNVLFPSAWQSSRTARSFFLLGLLLLFVRCLQGQSKPFSPPLCGWFSSLEIFLSPSPDALCSQNIPATAAPFPNAVLRTEMQLCPHICFTTPLPSTSASIAQKKEPKYITKYSPFPNNSSTNSLPISYMVPAGIPCTMGFCFVLASVIPTKFLTGFYCRSNTSRKPHTFLVQQQQN